MFPFTSPPSPDFANAYPLAAASLAGIGLLLLAAMVASWLWLRRERRQLPRRRWALRFPRKASFPPDAAAAWLAALRPALRPGGEPLALELRGGPQGTKWTVDAPDRLAAAVRAQLAAWFPEARLEELPPEPPEPLPGTGAELRAMPLIPARSEFYPLRTGRPREPDPLLGVLAAVSANAASGLRIEVGPPPSDWVTWSALALPALSRGAPLPPRGLGLLIYKILHHSADPPRKGAIRPEPALLRDAGAKAHAPAFSVRLAAWAAGPEGERRARELAAQVAAAAVHPLGNALGPGKSRPVPTPELAASHAPYFVLSAAELALLFHVPDAAHPLVPAEPSRIVLPPPELLRPREDGEPETVLGEALAADGPVPFGLSPPERRQHLYLVGKTGAGKSTLLAGIARQDLLAGRGFALLDPHGDLALRVLSWVPPEQEVRLVYFDPADREWTVGLNLLAYASPELRPLAASGVISAFKALFMESWGPRLEHLLRFALLLLLDAPRPSLAQLPLLLTDRAYRTALLEHCRDPLVRGFFQGEFEGYEGRFRSEALAPVLNKLGAALASPPVRHAVGGRDGGLPLRELLDGGGVLVANLSTGRLGADSSALLGGLLVAGLQLAAMARADVPEEGRRDFALLVDEFQHFGTDAFATILSEARKYRLSLALAHQYLDQVPDALLAAVLGNAGSLAVFRTGHADAPRLARELAPSFTAEDLVSLPGYRFGARVQRDGVVLPAFSARTVQLPEGTADPQAVAQRALRRWGRPRAAAELEVADLWEQRAE